jgi:hypothetical protein
METDVTLTLAFDMTALRRLRDPQVVFEEARGWAENVGVVAVSTPPAVSKFLREAELEPDFRSGPGGLSSAVLRDVAETYATDRYLLVGTTEDHRAFADEAEWAYRSVDAIAQAETWRLQYAPPEPEPTTFEDDEWP